MVSGKEIKGKIFSVQSMKKIICVMEMVVVSKMCKVQDCMVVSKFYVSCMCQVVVYFVNVDLEYWYIYL